METEGQTENVAAVCRRVLSSLVLWCLTRNAFYHTILAMSTSMEISMVTVGSAQSEAGGSNLKWLLSEQDRSIGGNISLRRWDCTSRR